MRIEGLGEVVVGTHPKASDPLGIGALGGGDQDRYVAVLAQRLEHGLAPHSWEHQVEDNKIGAVRLVGRQRRAAVAHIGHSVALALQVQTQQRAKARFVLDHQDVRRLTHRRILDVRRFRRCQDREP